MENILLRDTHVAADWCKNTAFKGRVQIPPILNMDEDKQMQVLQDLHYWEDEFDDDSPAGLFTFVFESKKDYDMFNEDLVDDKKLQLFAKFEEEK